MRLFYLFGEDLESEFSATGTKPFIKREQLDLRNQRSSDERSSEVNGVHGPNRFTREWPPSPRHDLGIKAQHRPMLSNADEPRFPIGCLRLGQQT